MLFRSIKYNRLSQTWGEIYYNVEIEEREISIMKRKRRYRLVGDLRISSLLLMIIISFMSYNLAAWNVESDPFIAFMDEQDDPDKNIQGHHFITSNALDWLEEHERLPFIFSNDLPDCVDTNSCDDCKPCDPRYLVGYGNWYADSVWAGPPEYPRKSGQVVGIMDRNLNTDQIDVFDSDYHNPKWHVAVSS